MANEATVTAVLQFAKGNVSTKSLSATNKQFTVSGTNYLLETQSIPTTAGGTAIKIGGLATVGLALIKNNDGTNYVQIMDAVSENVIMRLLPGEVALFRFDAAVTAPAAIAHTGAVQIEYLILEA